MENLQKTITGDWFDLKSVMEHPVELFDFFEFSKAELNSLIEEIYLAVEGGILEYKSSILNSVFNLTESLKYDTAALNRLDEVADKLKHLTYAVLLERLISKKAVKYKLKNEEKPDNNSSEAENSPKVSVSDIGNIVKEIQDLLAKDPAVRADKNIQNILIQVSKYKKENEAMKKLINNIPKDKLDNFKANYSRNINNIFSSLINSYNQFIKEKTGETVKKPASPLELYDLTIISELLKKQGEEIAAIKSTLDYAARERFQIRDIIMTADSRKAKIKELLDEEKKKLFNIALSEQGAREVSRNLSLEIVENLKKELENL